MTLEERIEKHVRDSFYSYKSEADRKGYSADGAFKGYIKRMLEDVAEAAKLEERRRIEEALPEKRVLRDADYDSCGGDFGESYKCGIDEGFNDCLDQVRSIINPQI